MTIHVLCVYLEFGHIYSMPKVEEKRTCRHLRAMEAYFNLCLHIKDNTYVVLSGGTSTFNHKV